MLLISYPLWLARYYSIPMSEVKEWDRNRAAIAPMFIVFAFFWLNGNLQTQDISWLENKHFWISLICFIPGMVFGYWVVNKTHPKKPPSGLTIAYAILSFIMSIMWISCSCSAILDIIELFGLISPIPPAVLALTIIAWGNQLGDMSSDVAMVKRGFGEMAITATVAGPLFNTLIGLGMALVLSITSAKDPNTAYIRFSLKHQDGPLKGEWSSDIVTVLLLIIG